MPPLASPKACHTIVKIPSASNWHQPLAVHFALGKTGGGLVDTNHTHMFVHAFAMEATKRSSAISLVCQKRSAT